MIQLTTQNHTIPSRQDIELKDTWRLEDMYENTEMWQKAVNKVVTLSEEILNFRTQIGTSSETLLHCLQKQDELSSILDQVYVYAKMKRDEDNQVSEYQGMTQKANSLLTDVISKTAFILPEISKIPEKTLKSYFAENTKLALYTQYIQEIQRQKSHILSEQEERLLGMAHDITTIPQNTFSMYNNADLTFPSIEDENGNMVELTKGRYATFLESTQQSVRKNAFDTLYSTYKKHQHTLASTLFGNLQCAKFYAQARNYTSSLESSLDSDNISTDVYHQLIETVNQHLPLLNRYLSLRKKALKLDTLHMYDLYVPLFPSPSKNIDFNTAKKMVSSSLTVLGEDYGKILQEAFDNRWIDVYENTGKTSGAYSWGAYLSHPYVLLNYQGKLNDVFTLAHEMGHALHSYFTNQHQPYIYSEYKIFVAEVASTVNEALLTHHLLSQKLNKEEEGFIINHFLDEFRGTIFRQVMFSEFERSIHQKTQKGEPLNAKTFSDIYYALNERYFGSDVVIDKAIEMEWCRIPHFYNSFYVYKYATGLTSALSITKQILEKGDIALKPYLSFLCSGNADYPLTLLKNTGVDLLTPKPFEDAFKMFETYLDRLEGCL